ncbi:MAG: hypothetical protein HY367_04395 [Candidatus Aenigmarchaeota archaeon]|nr:hypothetical protein [Candidatus Aenigmarchaeota archaeon]
MMKLKVYIAGKVSPDSVFGTHEWRDGFCRELSRLTGFDIVNLDPARKEEDENDSMLIFGRDCFMIREADIVIVNLTDDISVGGSQEMLIAKYYRKPLVGVAPKGGKFSKEEKEILGKKYKDWMHPFVAVPCDKVVANMEGLAGFVKEFFSQPGRKVKGLSVLDEALEYYAGKKR